MLRRCEQKISTVKIYVALDIASSEAQCLRLAVGGMVFAAGHRARNAVGTSATRRGFIQMARMIYSDFREPAASAACDIAFNFLSRSGAIRDEFEAIVFLTQYLTAMVDHGHSNKILMANRAISAYQAMRLDRP